MKRSLLNKDLQKSTEFIIEHQVSLLRNYLLLFLNTLRVKIFAVRKFIGIRDFNCFLTIDYLDQ